MSMSVSPGHTHTDDNVCPTSCPGHPRFTARAPEWSSEGPRGGRRNVSEYEAQIDALAKSLERGYGSVTDPDDNLPDHCRHMARRVIESDWYARTVADAFAQFDLCSECGSNPDICRASRIKCCPDCTHGGRR
jgi:hypothetical protein